MKQQISVPSGHPALTVNGDSSDGAEAGAGRAHPALSVNGDSSDGAEAGKAHPAMSVNGDSSDGDKVRAGWKATVPFSCCLSSFCHDLGFLALKLGIPGLNRATTKNLSNNSSCKKQFK